MKQYIIQKYVLANSVIEAVKKSKRMPIHEVYVHNAWFEKVGLEFFPARNRKIGFDNPQLPVSKEKVV